MGYTLDQLLDETGVKDLSGHNKKASTPPKTDFSKLAERCRRALTATPGERTDSSNRELAEKTAAIAVIGRTLAEIREIEDAGGQEKTAAPAAAPTINVEAFIKTALDAGHSPEAIATFLEKNAIFGGIGRAIHGVRAGMASGRAARATTKATELGEKATQSWQSLARKYEGLPDASKSKFVRKLTVERGPEEARKILASSPGFHGLPEFKALGGGSSATPGAAGGLGGLASSAVELAKKHPIPTAVGATFLGTKMLDRDKGKKDEDDDRKVVVVD